MPIKISVSIFEILKRCCEVDKAYILDAELAEDAPVLSIEYALPVLGQGQEVRGMNEKMDRSALLKAKMQLLSQLLKIPDWEKTSSDTELEAELMNDSEVNVCFRSEKEEAEESGQEVMVDDRTKIKG